MSSVLVSTGSDRHKTRRKIIVWIEGKLRGATRTVHASNNSIYMKFQFCNLVFIIVILSFRKLLPRICRLVDKTELHITVRTTGPFLQKLPLSVCPLCPVPISTTPAPCLLRAHFNEYQIKASILGLGPPPPHQGHRRLLPAAHWAF